MTKADPNAEDKRRNNTLVRREAAFNAEVSGASMVNSELDSYIWPLRLRDVDLRECLHNAARIALSGLEPGFWIFGFTKGQFSLADMMLEVIEHIGPCELDVCTWTVAGPELRTLNRLMIDGSVLKLRWLLDKSFKNRAPEFWDILMQAFGPESVRVTHTHAKFITFKADDWRIVLRGSMNMNANPRFEFFEISDDPRLYEFVTGFVDECFERMEVGQVPEYTPPMVANIFKSLEVNGDFGDFDGFDFDF